MSLKREEHKTFKIRRGLDNNENPAVEVEVQPDGGEGKVTTAPLTPDVDKFLKEVERRADEENVAVPITVDPDDEPTDRIVTLGFCG